MFRVFGVGWLLRVETVNVLAGKAFIKLAWKLAVFFAFAIVLEAVIVVYVRSKIDLFASKILRTLRLGVLWLGFLTCFLATLLAKNSVVFVVCPTKYAEFASLRI